MNQMLNHTLLSPLKGTVLSGLLFLMILPLVAQKAFIPCFQENSVRVIDLSTNSLLDVLYLGQGPLGVDISPDGKIVAVSLSAEGRVILLNSDDHSVIDTLKTGSSCFTPVFSPSGKELAVVDHFWGSLSIMDVASGDTVHKISIPGEFAHCLYSADGKALYLSNTGGDSIYKINPLTGIVDAQVYVGRFGRGMVLSPGGKLLYATSQEKNWIQIIDVATFKPIGNIPTGSGLAFLETSPDGSLLYGTSLFTDSLVVIDRESQTIIGRVKVGKYPLGIDITPDGKVAYVCNHESRSVSIVDLESLTILDTIRVGRYPYGYGNFLHYPQNPFVTRWETTSPNDSIRILINEEYADQYNYNIDWGDGTQDIRQTGYSTHAYTVPDTYQISITGAFPAMVSLGPEPSYHPTGLQHQLVSLEQWGDIKWVSMDSMFHSAKFMVNHAIDKPNLYRVVEMQNMFTQASSFDADLSEWNVGHVENLSGIFKQARSFNGNTSNWDTRSTQNMSSMFYGAEAFDRSLGNWNMAAVLTVDSMLHLSGLSRTNYDSTLIGWAQQEVQTDLSLVATGLMFCEGEAARSSLLSGSNWTIVGDTLNCAVGIFSETSTAPFSIYPVPSQDFLTIDIEVPDPTNIHISIVDMQGRVVIRKSQQVKETRDRVHLELESLLNGPYVIQIITEKKAYHKSFVIQR